MGLTSLWPSLAAPWSCPRLQRAGTTCCPGRTGTPGWGRACSGGMGSPRLWETTDPGLDWLPGPVRQASGCRVPCIGARWHAQLQDAICWCPLGCLVLRVGAQWCAWLCDAVRWWLPVCHVLVPTGMHSCMVPCIGAFQHPTLPAGEQMQSRADALSQRRWEAGDQLTGSPASSTREE